MSPLKDVSGQFPVGSAEMGPTRAHLWEIRGSRRGRRMLASVFLLTAVCLSAWLFLTTLDPPSGRVGEVGSGDLLASRFSRFVGIPVSLLGIGLYSVTSFLAVSTSAARTWMSAGRGILAWTIVFAAGWFFSMQFVFLGTFNQWFSLTHLLASVAAVLLLVRSRARGCSIYRRLLCVIWQAGVAAVVVCLFAVTQIRFSPPSPPRPDYEVSSHLPTEQQIRFASH